MFNLGSIPLNSTGNSAGQDAQEQVRRQGTTVKRWVGGARLRGELRFHAKIQGTAPGLRLILWLRLFCKSSGLKCLEQTLVPSAIEKYAPTFNISSNSTKPLFSEVFIVWQTEKGNLFARIFVSLILLRTQWNTAICWHLSADLWGENLCVSQSYPAQRLKGPLLFAIFPNNTDFKIFLGKI